MPNRTTTLFAGRQDGSAKQLLWALPTLVIAVGVMLTFWYDVTVPAPFFSLIVSVVVAGTYGGKRAGVPAALIAATFLLYSFFAGYGPPELTSSLLNVMIGTGLFVVLGVRLGQIKDDSDAKQIEILEANEQLKSSLINETEEKNKQTAQASESEDQLRMAIRISGIGYYKWDFATGDCLFCSKQHAAHFGLKPEQFYDLNKGRQPYTGNIHEDDKATFIEAVARIDGGEAVLFEYRAVHPDGTVRFIRQITEPVFDANGKQIEVVGSSIDLTDLREAEARVRQSQRIEAIGTLTGGVAHDFNNILAIIMGNIELAQDAQQGTVQQEYLDHALTATRRGASLTRNLLSFARRAHLDPSRLNLNDSVRQTMNWSARVLPETILIDTKLSPMLWDCELDATSLENAIVNIVLNARDAMPGGGAISIETENVTLTQDHLPPHSHGIVPGEYVTLSITDTGRGIDPTALEKIFEPFHTSKPFGEGSGLGLSMVEGFIKQSGGHVRVTSELGKGTQFKLYFKAVTVPANHAGQDTPSGTPAQVAGQRILLAEDEEEVARVTGQTLAEAGYRVVPAKNGVEGLKLFRDDGPFDLILTDVVMPGSLQGPALVRAIRETHPDMPCIFMSGYASETKIESQGMMSSDLHLMKPISRKDLLAAVSQALKTPQHA
ncbi:MAG: ATP-binding protein [Pseudomonadota bacterium]